jgi:hypothetical protein
MRATSWAVAGAAGPDSMVPVETAAQGPAASARKINKENESLNRDIMPYHRSGTTQSIPDILPYPLPLK